jgi:hypothetical protein
LYKTFHGNKDANGMGLFIVKNHLWKTNPFHIYGKCVHK